MDDPQLTRDLAARDLEPDAEAPESPPGEGQEGGPGADRSSEAILARSGGTSGPAAPILAALVILEQVWPKEPPAGRLVRLELAQLVDLSAQLTAAKDRLPDTCDTCAYPRAAHPVNATGANGARWECPDFRPGPALELLTVALEGIAALCGIPEQLHGIRFALNETLRRL